MRSAIERRLASLERQMAPATHYVSALTAEEAAAMMAANPCFVERLYRPPLLTEAEWLAAYAVRSQH
jgi:hypothetical protein